MLTTEDLERRRQFITATDVPALLGVSPWRNKSDVYLEKTQGLNTFKGNDAADAGNLLEPSVIAWAATKLGPINPGDWMVHENGINACTLDGTTGEGDVVEAKTSGIVGPANFSQWGEEGSDEIPDYYVVQTQAQLLITGAETAFVPALIGGRGFVMFVVSANRELQEFIREESERFWREHVVPGIQPDDFAPSLESLKAMRRTPGKVADVPDDLAERFLKAQQDAKAANDRLDIVKGELIVSLGDADGGRYSAGEFTYFEQTRRGYTVADTSFRVLRHKAPKKAKALAMA